MNTLADRVYFEDAIEALEQCVTDIELGEWSDIWCSTEEYMHLPDDLSKRLEAAYRKRVAHVLGGLA